MKLLCAAYFETGPSYSHLYFVLEDLSALRLFSEANWGTLCWRVIWYVWTSQYNTRVVTLAHIHVHLSETGSIFQLFEQEMYTLPRVFSVCSINNKQTKGRRYRSREFGGSCACILISRIGFYRGHGTSLIHVGRSGVTSFIRVIGCPNCCLSSVSSVPLYLPR